MSNRHTAVLEPLDVSPTPRGDVPGVIRTQADSGRGIDRNVLGLSVISIVDDDESVRAATKALLRSAGYDVETFASAELFLNSGALRETVCLILDIRMPGMDGLELQRRLNATESRVPIIFVTAHDDKANRQMAMEAGAVDFFHKPFEGDALVRAIRAALKTQEDV